MTPLGPLRLLPQVRATEEDKERQRFHIKKYSMIKLFLLISNDLAKELK